jgi:hypothetical protein
LHNHSNRRSIPDQLFVCDSKAAFSITVPLTGCWTIRRTSASTASKAWPADDPQKLVSSLASLEVRSAIRRRLRAGEVLPSDVARFVLDGHPLRALDALHLATCVVMRDTLQVSDICFVSAHDALLKAAAAEQFLILNPLQI